LLRGRAGVAAVVACVFGVLGHDAMAGGLAPSLKGIWLSQRVAEALTRADLNPRQGLAPGPVTVAGYAEPSLVFALGAPTVLGDGQDAAQAIDEGRPVVVEQRQEAAFCKALAEEGDAAVQAGEVTGLDYSSGHRQVLRLYRPSGAGPED
ncbi:MAG: ArnT family glycosyltransferase, partial [Caulobacteraceae bacterium]